MTSLAPVLVGCAGVGVGAGLELGGAISGLSSVHHPKEG